MLVCLSAKVRGTLLALTVAVLLEVGLGPEMISCLIEQLLLRTGQAGRLKGSREKKSNV